MFSYDVSTEIKSVTQNCFAVFIVHVNHHAVEKLRQIVCCIENINCGND